MPDSFSQRRGLAGPPPGMLFREEVPVSFRRFLIELPHNKSISLELHEMRDVVCDVLQVWPKNHEPPYFDYKPHIQECEWFRIYDIIEGIYGLLHQKGMDNPFASTDTASFVKVINEAFVAQNIGWQIRYNSGKVETRGDETFENTITTAVSVLVQEQKPTAAQNLRSAITALSARPKPNTIGAVAHATSAVECVLHAITGEAMTLGEYLNDKEHSKLFHGALIKGLHGIYGYASDVARHGKEGTEPTREEAEFVLAICAATCTFLSKRHTK